MIDPAMVDNIPSMRRTKGSVPYSKLLATSSVHVNRSLFGDSGRSFLEWGRSFLETLELIFQFGMLRSSDGERLGYSFLCRQVVGLEIFSVILKMVSDQLFAGSPIVSSQIEHLFIILNTMSTYCLWKTNQ